MITKEQQAQNNWRDKKIAENIEKIKHRILVFSGKGGVGKTTVSVNIAHGLQSHGYTTGILDADITGPNVPKMTGLTGNIHKHGGRVVSQTTNGVKVISMANILPPNEAVIWRGPMRSKMLYEFLGNVNFEKMDFLIADLPPRTGDEVLTIVQDMKPDMAIIITTPQEISLIDSARAINMAKKMNIPQIALIENMSGLICPECGRRIDLFGAGGGKKQAKEMNIDFFGKIPINLEARELADNGKPIVLENKKADISIEICRIIKRIEEKLQ